MLVLLDVEKTQVTLKEYFTKLYYQYRSNYIHGKWLTVTFTPKGKDVPTPVVLDRLKSVIDSTKSVDCVLLVPELSKQNVYHLHGFMHVKVYAHKLKFIKDNDMLQLLIARAGSPEGWIRYIFKNNPQYFIDNFQYIRMLEFLGKKIIKTKFLDKYLSPFKENKILEEDIDNLEKECLINEDINEPNVLDENQ